MSIVIDSAKHLIPGYSIYHAQQTASSDAPFAIKVRDSVMASTITAFHFTTATHHAQKIMNITRSTKGPLARNWMALSRVIPALFTAGGAAVVGVGALVIYTAMNEPSRTDTSLNIPYRSISGRHHGNSYLS